MNNACSSNSKPPFTKLMDLVSNYSISFFMDTFIRKKTFRASKKINNFKFD
jgi:hypothetical protein